MKLRDLFVSIGFDVDDKDLIRLDKGLEKTKGIILAIGAAAVGAAGMLYGMAKSVADTGDKAAKTADKLGVQIEALQELRYAAELSGIAQNNFDTGLQRMTRRAAEAAEGTGVAKDAFKELGVVLKDSQGRVRKSEAILADIAEGMAKVEDPSRRVALAFKLFDTEGVSMVNMLRNGKDALAAMRTEARALGFVIGEEDARNAEQFNDNLLRTKLIITGVRNEVGARFLPVLSELMVRFRQWIGANRHVIKSGLEKTLRGAVTLLGWLYNAGRGVVGVLSDIAGMFGGIERAAKAAAWAIGLFAGAQVLMAIGNLSMGIMGLVTATKVFGNTAMVAWIKAAWLPLLVGAAIAALIVILQDMYTYFTGGDSVTGILIEAFEKKFPRAFAVAAFYVGYFKDMIISLNAFLAAGIDYLMGLLTLDWGRMTRAFENMLHAFDPLIERWKTIIGSAVDWIMEKLQPVIDALNVVRGWTSAAKNMIGDKLGGAWNIAQDLFTMGPGSAPVRGAVDTRTDVRVNAPVTVTVPADTPPEIVGRAVQQGVSDGIARMLRDASLATEPQVEH
jgi:hypothetical protein